MNVKNEPLPRQMGQALGATSQLYQAYMDALLRPHELTFSQFAVLIFLARQSAPVSISDIQMRVALTQSAVTKVVQKFERLALVEIIVDSADKRTKRVALTSHGRRTALNLQMSFSEPFAELLDGLPEEKQEITVEVLNSLIAKLQSKLQS